jgi:hypothetical protein
MEDLHHDRHSYVAAWALFAYPMNEKRVDVTSYLQLVPSSDVEELTPRSCAGCFTAAMSCCTTRSVCTRRAHSCARAPGARDLARVEVEVEAALVNAPTHALVTF